MLGMVLDKAFGKRQTMSYTIIAFKNDVNVQGRKFNVGVSTDSNMLTEQKLGCDVQVILPQRRKDNVLNTRAH